MSFAVKAQDIVVTYGDTVAIDTSTFTVPAGKVTAIIGPNGSGKSTLLNTIAGLTSPRSGSIEVPAARDGSHRISYVLQTTKINETLPVSAAEVVLMGRYAALGSYKWIGQADRDAVAAAMERVGITDIASKHLSELSGGQRQRVFVAQGMAQDHDLLLLDEPLTGIDITTAQAIDTAIHEEIDRGCSVILTTHDLSEAQVADYVLLLSGRVVAAGPPDEVLTTEHLADAYGQALLHVDEGRIFIDDAAHAPTDSRHVHRDRSIHTESSPSDAHGH
ncbi:MAG: metal ABC transporter ATP-binding protein [Acidimicrobiia bacterium]|nr:metal ABC transporter ATP-binding protein [Acidimicrobiia bacterium]